MKESEQRKDPMPQPSADRGYLHVYTGNGKGKTTAAFGLAVRALCAGRDVYVGQFVKSMKYSETRVEELFESADSSFGRLHVEQLGRGCFIDREPAVEDIRAAEEGLKRCAEALASGRYGVVILDEVTIALHFGLLEVGRLLAVLAGRAPQTEAVVTGRYAPAELLAAADLVTEMREVKHYYTLGVPSREGIDH